MTETVITYRPTTNRAWNPGAVDGFLGAVVKGKPEVSYNTSRTDSKGRKLADGIELRFGDARPTEQVRAKLKEHGFRFSEKQVLWYAKDNATTRALIDSLEVEEWEIDTTVYEKHSFWALVRSIKEYNDLRGWVEFMVNAGGSNSFYNSKKQLEARESPYALVGARRLKFKKYWSKPVGADGEGEGGGEGDGESDEAEGGGSDDGHQEDENPGDEGGESEDHDESEGRDSKLDDHQDIAEKLARAAAAMQPQIDRKMNPPIASQAYTARRQRIIDGLKVEGRQMQRIQSVLAALSKVWAEQRVESFPLLAKVRLRSHVELLLKYGMYADADTKPATVQASLDHNKAKLNHLEIFTRYNWADTYRQVKELLKDEAPAEDPRRQKEEELAEMIAKVRGMEIPGFFPTPDILVDRMIGLAETKAADRILDPSAGIGSILDRVAALRNGGTMGLEAVEIQSSLAAILEKKGYKVIGRDFMAQNPDVLPMFRHDKVLMNPPFEDGQDVEHVTHALSFLKPGGRLVAIMGAGSFYRDFKRDKAFRELLTRRNAWVSNPIKDAFKSSFNPTGVAVRMVVINADGKRPLVGGREIGSIYDGEYWTHGFQEGNGSKAKGNENDDLELLELEAEAELELLKMRVEQERRAKGILNGLGATDPGKLESLRRKAWSLMDSIDVMEFK